MRQLLLAVIVVLIVVLAVILLRAMFQTSPRAQHEERARKLLEAESRSRWEVFIDDLADGGVVVHIQRGALVDGETVHFGTPFEIGRVASGRGMSAQVTELEGQALAEAADRNAFLRG